MYSYLEHMCVCEITFDKVAVESLNCHLDFMKMFLPQERELISHTKKANGLFVFTIYSPPEIDPIFKAILVWKEGKWKHYQGLKHTGFKICRSKAKTVCYASSVGIDCFLSHR